LRIFVYTKQRKQKAMKATTITKNGTWTVCYDRNGNERRVFIPNK